MTTDACLRGAYPLPSGFATGDALLKMCSIPFSPLCLWPCVLLDSILGPGLPAPEPEIVDPSCQSVRTAGLHQAGPRVTITMTAAGDVSEVSVAPSLCRGLHSVQDTAPPIGKGGECPIFRVFTGAGDTHYHLHSGKLRHLDDVLELVVTKE